MRIHEKKQDVKNDELCEVPLTEIMPNPNQPRAIFDNEKLSELAVSINKNGLLNPLCVRKTGANSYEIIAGERRFRAAKMLNLERIPCIVKNATEQESAVLAILENIQRADLNFIEEAFAFAKLIREHKLTQEECASRLGIAQPTVANKLRLLRLTEEDIRMIVEHNFNERQARALLRLSPDMRGEAILKISELQLNSLKTEQYVENLLKAKVRPKQHTWIYRQSRLYINTLNHTIDAMKKAGIDCTSTKTQNDGFLEYTLRIKMAD